MDMRRRIRGRRARRGFSLLEIILVIVILGILAAFVVPNLVKTGDKAKIDATKAMIGKSGNIALAINLYRTHLGVYPEELANLTERPDDEDLADKWSGPYIEDPNSLKDAWQRDLQYKSPGENNEDSYDLWSYGPDGEDGTDDDIGNWEKG
jgi:general secretion pathway protein G